jgi:hypothetical protein
MVTTRCNVPGQPLPIAGPDSRLLLLGERRLLGGTGALQIATQAGTDAEGGRHDRLAADVGFGSFYNHFSSKAELFEAAVEDVLEETGQLLDRLSTDVDDPRPPSPARSGSRSGSPGPREMANVLVRHAMDEPTPWRTPSSSSGSATRRSARSPDRRC